MIWLGLITAFAAFLAYICDQLNYIHLVLPDSIFNSFSDFIGILFYLFPVKALTPILGVSLAFYVVRGVIALIRFIKSFIPTMGG